jgi:hypothetical protein
MSEVKNVNDSSVKRNRKTKKVKEGPQRAKSAYLFYCVENRPFVVSENPEIKNTEIVTELAKRWNSVKTEGGDGYKKYEDLAKNDKERYDQEKTEWENNKPQETPEPVVAPEKPKKKAASKKAKTPVEPVQEAVPVPVPEPVVEEEVLEEEVVEQPKVEEKPKKGGKGGGAKGKKTKA